MNYEPIIGFEIHVELATASKMFCGCKNDPFFAKQPNIYTCPVCLGMPGALPVPNRKAVEWTILLGLALGCDIPLLSKFDRKHYFYPDLPKGYQISQYDMPLAVNGRLVIASASEAIYPPKGIATSSAKRDPRNDRIIRIRRVHLEEDTAKLLHTTIDVKKVTLVNFNRSGVPLLEIVTEPDIRSAEEAKVFLKKIHQIIRYLDISDADMEKGSMRLEPNISVRKVISDKQKAISKTELPKYKVEVKNINSFRFAGRAIEYEVARQIELLEKGETPKQENRGWNEEKGATVSQRGKEEAEDYRYFPEPDIPPMRFTQYQISKIKDQIGELPAAKLERFVKQYGINEHDAALLVETRGLADYYEEAVMVAAKVKESELTPKKIGNWLINRGIDRNTVLPADLIRRIMAASQKMAIDQKEIQAVVRQVLAENPQAVADFKKGKEQVVMFLVGKARAKQAAFDAQQLILVIKKLIGS